MRTFVATSNTGKLDEMKAIFAHSALELETHCAYRAVDEGEKSYLDNALLKARALHAQLRSSGIAAWVLADDSGLEVDALDGRPGVLSARYAGVDACWCDRRAALLDEMRSIPDARRSARFFACMVLLFEDQTWIYAEGSVAGSISLSERGNGGFGYDPIFHYPPAHKTFAQLSATEKNRCSHRHAAGANLLRALRSHGR